MNIDITKLKRYNIDYRDEEAYEDDAGEFVLFEELSGEVKATGAELEYASWLNRLQPVQVPDVSQVRELLLEYGVEIGSVLWPFQNQAHALVKALKAGLK